MLIETGALALACRISIEVVETRLLCEKSTRTELFRMGAQSLRKSVQPPPRRLCRRCRRRHGLTTQAMSSPLLLMGLQRLSHTSQTAAPICITQLGHLIGIMLLRRLDIPAGRCVLPREGAANACSDSVGNKMSPFSLMSPLSEFANKLLEQSY